MTIEEFNTKLKAMEEAYPGDAGESLEKGAKKMVKALKKETPDSGKSHKNKLKKSWKMEMVDAWGKSPVANIRNKAPHYHLVERGVQNPKDFHGHPKPEWRASLNKNVGFFKKAVDSNWDSVKETMQKDFMRKVRGHLG